MTFNRQVTNKDIFGKSLLDILNDIREGKRTREEAFKLQRAQSEAKRRPIRESNMDIDNYDEELEFSSKRKLTKEQIRIRETHALYLQNLEKYSQQKQLLKDLDFSREYIDKKNGNRYVPLKKSYI